MKPLTDISEDAGAFAQGHLDFSVDGNYIGDFSPIRKVLEDILHSQNITLGQISQSADQVASGSEQISSGAQALSQVATKQASPVEELAATINEISRQVDSNASNAEIATQKAALAGDEVGERNRGMQYMLSAMAEISSSSGPIGKIIKPIEDIAFQTNILVLNAAA